MASKASWSPAQTFAAVFGAVYLLAGIAGFFLTGFSGFTAMDGPRLLGLFMVNPLHNIVHIVLGVAWLVASRALRTARLVNLTFGIGLGLVTVLGFGHLLRFLSIHDLADPDNFLHLASAVLALYFGSVGAERVTSHAGQTA